jgi:IS30 family transposase
MSTRADYAQIATKLDYAALEKKMEQLSQRAPPRKRKTAADLLEPLREQLLTLHRKGWSSGQLAEELKAAGVPVSPARLRRWMTGGNGAAKPRNRRRSKRAVTNHQPTIPANQAGRGSESQTGLKLPQH